MQREIQVSVAVIASFVSSFERAGAERVLFSEIYLKLNLNM